MKSQSRDKRALHHADLPNFFYPSPPPDDRNEVETPELPKGQPQRPQEQGDDEWLWMS